MFQCFHCLHNSVVWDSDFSFEDYDYEGEGIVQLLHCSNCGADIEYRIPLEENKEDKIKREITEFCKECNSHESCPEEECILYRIEKIIEDKNDNSRE